MSDQEKKIEQPASAPLIKLAEAGDVYHVEKNKMEIVLKYLLTRPFGEVGGILQGLVSFDTSGQNGQSESK